MLALGLFSCGIVSNRAGTHGGAAWLTGDHSQVDAAAISKRAQRGD